MAKAKDDRPIVIMGTGIPAVAAVINKLIDISDTVSARSPAVSLLVLDTKDQPRPDSKSGYPLNGQPIDKMHPFKTAKPPPGFPTFGEFAREKAAEDPSWKSALRVPTYKQVNDYMQYTLELAVQTVGAKAEMEFSSKSVKNIQENLKNGPATINFRDGTSLDVKQIIRANKPPNMGGPDLVIPANAASLATSFNSAGLKAAEAPKPRAQRVAAKVVQSM